MSDAASGMNWRILIVEDNAQIVKLLKEVAPSFVDAPDSVDVFDFESFQSG